MKSVQSHPSAALLGVANKPPLTWELPQPRRPIALKVATLLDGKGGTLRDTVVVVSGDKIERIGGPVPQGAQVYDLGGLTVAPGLIDTHVHVTYHFSHDRFIDNRLVGQDEPVPELGPVRRGKRRAHPRGRLHDGAEPGTGHRVGSRLCARPGRATWCRGRDC